MSHLTTPPVYRYPPEINIYRRGSFSTAFVAVIRLATLMILAVGTFGMAPVYTYLYFFPDEIQDEREKPVKWYLPPLILLGSWVPAVAAFFALAPWVHHIHVHLPMVARKSEQDLMRWASNVPRNTIINISIMRLSPRPMVQYAAWEDLSRLPRGRMQLSNLEHKPVDHHKYLADNKGSLRARLFEWMTRRVLGRYYVDRVQTKDKSGVPGVWDKMWEQIPMKGQREQRMAETEQKKAGAKAPGPRMLPQRRRTGKKTDGM